MTDKEYLNKMTEQNLAAHGSGCGGPVMLACVLLLLLLCSCRTVSLDETWQTTHATQADTLSAEVAAEVHTQAVTVNTDSIVSVVMERTHEELSRMEHEHETVVETFTETVDSIGRVVRQTQKTTDRTVSKQERQRTERTEQLVREEVSKALTHVDSLWHERFSQYQAHVSDSLGKAHERHKATEAQGPLSWVDGATERLRHLAFIAVAIWLVYRLIKFRLRR